MTDGQTEALYSESLREDNPIIEILEWMISKNLVWCHSREAKKSTYNVFYVRSTDTYFLFKFRAFKEMIEAIKRIKEDDSLESLLAIRLAE